MNPVREEEETEIEVLQSWREKTEKTKGTAKTEKRPLKLKRLHSDLSRDQIEKILENYNFQNLHDRIMKKILD